MNYSEHYTYVKENFQELDLLKESEFELFKNYEFAKETIELCIQLCESASQKLNIDLHFGILFNNTFNASANTKNGTAAITFNLGLIDKLEIIIFDSIELFMHENIASMTIQGDKKENLKKIAKNCCINYLFHHELAHILQMLKINLNGELNLQEQYSSEIVFEINNHICEIDADHFGSSMSCYHLLEQIKNSSHQFDTIILFN